MWIQKNRGLLVCFSLLAILFVAEYFQLRSSKYMVDDAYISFRYAKNFAEGQGLVFNQGERVEGYSNLLLVLILSAFIKTGFEPAVVSLTIGHLSGLAVIIVIFLLSNLTANRLSSSSLIVPFLLAINPLFSFWSNGGLETQLNTLLLTLSVFLFYRIYLRNEKKYSKYYIVTTVFFILNRPENFLLVMASWVWLIFFNIRNPKEFFCEEVGNVSIIMVFLILLFAWRLFYYGYPLPNTVYAKGYYSSILLDGDISIFMFIQKLFTNSFAISYINNFLQNIGGVFVILFALVSLFFTKPKGLVFYLYFVITFYVGLVLWNRGDWMRNYRLFVPVIPLVFFLVLEGYRVLIVRVRSKFAVNILSGFFIVFFVAFTFKVSHVTENKRVTALGNLGKTLNKVLSSSDLLATPVLGNISYNYYGKVLDMNGLTDNYIAHNGRSTRMGKKDFVFVLSNDPTYLSLISLGGIAYHYINNRETMAAIKEFVYFDNSDHQKLEMYFFVRKDKLTTSPIENLFPNGEFVDINPELFQRLGITLSQ